jgi:CHAD domain-containing protein
MYKNELINYFDSKLFDVKMNYFLAVRRNDPEGVHDLRVELKRLKAFFNLIEFLNSQFFAKKRFRNFRAIAKNIGALRDTQVQAELAEEIKKTFEPDISEYLEYLKNKEKESVEAFKVFIQNDPLKKLKGTKKIISSILRGISQEQATTKV